MEIGRRAATAACIEPDRPLADAARMMIRDGVHALLVREAPGSPIVGILSDRDLVRRVAMGSDTTRAPVASAMSRVVTTLPETASRGEIAAKMRSHGIRHVPLVDSAGEVTRIVSLDALLDTLGGELADLAAAIRGEYARDPEPAGLGA